MKSSHLQIDPRVKDLLMKKYFPILYKYENKVKGKWGEKAEEEYGFHVFESAIWSVLFDWLLVGDIKGKIQNLVFLPYLKQNNQLAAVLKFRPLMAARLKTPLAFLKRTVGISIAPSQLSEEFMSSERVIAYQRAYFRCLFLSYLELSYKHLNLNFPEQFFTAKVEAKKNFDDLEVSLLFLMKEYVYGNSQIDGEEQSFPKRESGKIILL